MPLLRPSVSKSQSTSLSAVTCQDYPTPPSQKCLCLLPCCPSRAMPSKAPGLMNDSYHHSQSPQNLSVNAKLQAAIMHALRASSVVHCPRMLTRACTLVDLWRQQLMQQQNSSTKLPSQSLWGAYSCGPSELRRSSSSLLMPVVSQASTPVYNVSVLLGAAEGQAEMD